MKLSLSFGDIFKYKGEDYVYLAEAESGKYAAKILSVEITRELEISQEKLVRKGSRIPISQQILYLYLILETPEYEGRACFHGHGTKEHDNFEMYIDDLNITLNKSDLKKLRDDIMQKPLNGELKKEISKIKL